MKRITSTLGTAVIAAGVLVGTAVQASADTLHFFGPYNSLSICQVHQRDLQKAGGYTIAQKCAYRAPWYDDGRDVTFPGGYTFLATKP